MLWRTEGLKLEDLLPVPKKQPGRHFSSGYHMLGSLAPSYDVKYAQMTYGDHYRKKLENDIARERSRLDDILMAPKQQALNKKQSLRGTRSDGNQRRYDLNELRHHQRRCAALLFGARQHGEHQVPYLVRWAPRRRESYYLMSERIYNDRLLMKLREQEEEEKRKMLESPLVFDFDTTFGTTSHLHDFQNLINKTAKNIKDLSFDTEYNDNNFDFKEGERKKYVEPQGRVLLTPNNEDSNGSNTTHKKSKVTFGDVTDIESERYEGKLSRERKKAALAARKSGEDLDVSDIDVDFSPDALDDLLTDREGSNPSDILGVKSCKTEQNSQSQHRKNKQKNSNKMKLDGSQAFSLDDVSSFLSDRSVSDVGDGQHLEQQELNDELSQLGGVHNNKYCKHSPEYYKKPPNLLKLSELRKRAESNKKANEKTREHIGPYVTHECMTPYKTAYERALSLVRSRSLPQNPTDLYNRTTGRTFSYFPGMPKTEGFTFKTKTGKVKHLRTTTPSTAAGLKGILGDVDMNHFYREEDELIYYVKDEEINVVVESSVDTTESRMDADSDDDDDDDDDGTYEDSSETVTRATSEALTTKTKSSFDNDYDSELH